MDSPNSSRQPTTPYTSGLPHQPRMLVLPPSISCRDWDPNQQSIRNTTRPFLESFADIYPAEGFSEDNDADWKYELRREAQQVLPHIWLGPFAAAKNVSFLRENNITLLVAVRSSMTACARFVPPPIPGIRVKNIDISDSNHLISEFQNIHDTIDLQLISELPEEVRQRVLLPVQGRDLNRFYIEWRFQYPDLPVPGGRTLVFCESGNERSAAVVAAYIMQHYRVTAVIAIQMVQYRRFSVCFGDSIKWTLSSYEPLWRAVHEQKLRQYILQNTDPSINGNGLDLTPSKHKRRLDDIDDDNDTINSGRAPFLDIASSYDTDMS